VVVFVDRIDDYGARMIRIISARKATSCERQKYEQETGH
jgi:uncharacterized DUF497 family protein